MLRWLPLLFLASSCVTVSPNESPTNLGKGLGGVVATGTHHETARGSNAELGPYVQVRGSVMCENGSLRRANEYRAEVYRQGTPIGASELDRRWSFDLLKVSAYGTHEARLIEKRSGRVLDRHAFTSTAAEDRFDIIFADCQPKKKN